MDKKQFLKKNVFLLILLSVVFFLVLANYQPKSWLSGWDTLHPEFDFSLYFKRIIFSVWQEHQGLGVLASQAQAAEIPRILLLLPFSIFLPDFFIRYFYFFSTLVIGPLGLYFFLKDLVFEKLNKRSRETFSFSGALFYLLNLATLQQYNLPLEMFATQFAFLPWLFFLSAKYLRDGRKNNLFLFSVITFFAAPMAHTATLFFAYFLGLVLYLGSLLVFYRKKGFRRAFIILLFTFLINSFWLLPNIYFILNHGQQVADSKIHSQFSETALLTSQEFGNLGETALLKNYLFDWAEFDRTKNEFVPIFNEWLPHLDKPQVKALGYIFFILVMTGILFSLLKKNIQGIAILPIFLVAFFFIANNIEAFKIPFSLLQNKIPLFKEAFRFPFTKFSTLLSFSYAVYFAFALNFIIEFLKKKRLFLWLLPLITTLVLVYYMLPAFWGNFLSPSMKVSFPREYSEVFDWFGRQDPTGRIAHFPIHTFWGWVYYDWKYEGAGFWWFGLKQPFLDREFDRWSAFNENYYWEASYALYSKNLKLFEDLLEKYQISWLLVDKNVISPSSPKSTYLEKLEKLISLSEKITLVQNFGQIDIYQVKLNTPVNNFVFLAENIPDVGPTYQWNNFDRAYLDSGHYFSENSNFSVFYPFRSLFTGRKQEELEFDVQDEGNYFVFSKRLPKEVRGYLLETPPISKPELIKINEEDLSQITYLEPKVQYQNDEIKVLVPKIGGYFSKIIEPATDLSVRQAKNCHQFAKGEVKNEIVEAEKRQLLRLEATNAQNCSTSFWLPNLSHKLAYLITVESSNIKGRSLLFWLENLNIRKADIETYLPQKQNLIKSFFIQPPMEEDGLGYTLHFDNQSIGQNETINDLGRITVNLIPYEFLTGLKLTANIKQPEQNFLAVKATHPNPSLYEIPTDQITEDPNNVLVLSQSFQSGWLAYKLEKNVPDFLAPLFGEKIDGHVLVNNWQNGWRLDNLSQDKDQKIVILFWPQFLEFLGFGMLILVSGYFLTSFLKERFSQ